MKNKYTSAGFVLKGMLVLLPSSFLLGQDDIYYMPSKNSGSSTPKSVMADTSGMTNYEKYRAMRESNGEQPVNKKTSALVDRDSSARLSVFDTTNSITLNPAYVVVGNDTTQGAVIINNYYVDNDDRYDSYRRMYFDYYYSPYYYDPFYWDFSYSYGNPYFGFHYGYGYPYNYGYGYGYGYYDSYWYQPYWYAPYHYSYSNGYYSGYTNAYNYNRINSGNGNYSGGRRLGGYRAASTVGSASYYGGRYAGADTYHGTRRNSSINTSATTNSYPATSVRRQSNWDSYSGVSTATVRRSSKIENRTIATTRPYDGQTARRSGSSYTPSYSMPGTYTKANYNTSSDGSRRQTQNNYTNTSSGNAYIVNPNENTSRRNGGASTYVPVRSENASSSSSSTSTSTPRRSGESYSQPSSTSSQSVSTGDGGSRRSSSSATPSYSSGSNSSSSSSSSSSGSSGSSGGTGRRR